MLAGTAEDGRAVADGEMAREPRSLGVVAWFDGWAVGLGVGRNPGHFPRRLTLSEAMEWRAGHTQGRQERRS